MKKRWISYAIASIFASGAINAHADQEFWVTKTPDTFDTDMSGKPICAADNCSLRDAIYAANHSPGKSTIKFLHGGTYPIELQGDDDAGLVGDLDLLSHITIEGTTHDGTYPIIDGQHLDRVFDIHTDADVELNYLFIINGQRPYYSNLDDEKQGMGAGIRNVGILHLNHCNLAWNEGGNVASALSNTEGGQAFLTDNEIVFNTSKLQGSAIFSGDGDFIFNPPKNRPRLVINNSLIGWNTAGKNSGTGGIATAKSDLSLFHSKVIYNNAPTPADTGGISTVGEGNVNIGDSDISYNEGAYGGGISISTWENYNVTITETLIANNKSRELGGGVFLVYSNAKISNTTISNNVSNFDGGGIYSVVSGSNELTKIQLNNVTIAGNIAGTAGGGIYGPAQLQNTIVSNNSDSGTAPDCSGKLISNDYNLISNLQGCPLIGPIANSRLGVPSQLAPLKDNGGFTATHELLVSSPAINAGNNATCEARDQRGVKRNSFGPRCDMGAYEQTEGSFSW